MVGTLFSWLLGCSLSHIFKARILLVLITFEGSFPFCTVSNLRPGMDLCIIASWPSAHSRCSANVHVNTGTSGAI